MESSKTMFTAPASCLIGADFKLLSIPSSATLMTALTTLIKANVYGAPVASESNTQGSPAWIGFLELRDIVAFIVSLFQQQAVHPTPDNPSAQISTSLISSSRTFTSDQLSKIDARIKSITIKELFAISPPHSSAWSLTDTVPLQTVIDALSTRSRVVLLNGEGSITGLVSRSAIVNYIAKNSEQSDPKFKAIANMKLAEVPGLSDNRKLITSQWGNPDERALDGFAKLSETGISHLAIVSSEGGHFDLVGNLSVKDIKAVIEAGVSVLLEPLNQYVNKIRQENLKAVHPAIHESLEDTVQNCIVKFAVTKIHRMYVTGGGESSRHLVGVVTLGDIIRLLRTK